MNNLIKAYVSRSALRHNAQLLLKKTGEIHICAMVKANAYGHNVAIVSRALSGLSISFWGVASIKEAIELRELNLIEPILVLRPVGPYESEKALREQIELMAESALRATVVSEEGLDLLAKHTARIRKTIYIHIKVDTGMSRNGCRQEEAVSLVIKAGRIPYVKIEGIYSHFATAGEQLLEFAREQLSVFQSVIKDIESRGIHIPIKHMANSAAIFNLPESWLDMVRPGLALYGYRGPFINNSEELTPVLRLEAPVVMTKWIKKGRTCGYGRTFVAKRDTRIGLLPVGYADGYSRQWSNTGLVDVKGRLAPVIGRISMDLTIIDMTDIPEGGIGSKACIISNQREAPNSVESMAKKLGTIPHEITSRLGSRIKRDLVD